MALTVKQKAEIENALIDYGLGHANEEYDGYACIDSYVWNGSTLTATFAFMEGVDPDVGFGGASEEVAAYRAANPEEEGDTWPPLDGDEDDAEYIARDESEDDPDDDNDPTVLRTEVAAMLNAIEEGKLTVADVRIMLGLDA